MRKHTPGTWHANAIAKGRIIGDAGTPGAEKIQINNANATIATVYRSDDARLIAAAPQLLEALRELFDIIESEIGYDLTSEYSDTEREYAKKMMTARKLIALAEGHA